MFLLKKLLTPFLLPPGIFIVVLAAAAVWLFWKRRVKAGLFHVSMALLIWILSTAPFSNAVIGGLESGLRMPENPAGDVIVLLGGGIHDEVVDLTGQGSPTSAAFGRIVTAARLYRRLQVPVIVSGGKVYESKGREAPILKRFLVDLGVPEEKVIQEDKSRDTMENAVNVKEICAGKGFKRPLLVTSGLHMRRAIFSFEKAGLAVVPVPTGILGSSGRKWAWDDFLPSAASLQEISASLHEYGGLLFYRVWN